MTICKKGERPSHQKSSFFIAGKGVHLSLKIRLSRKSLKGLLQNTYLMLDLVYHKRNLIITTVVDGRIF